MENKAANEEILPVVNKCLMQNYSLGLPIAANAEFKVTRGGDGGLRIYTVGDDQIYKYEEDSSSDTGWKMINIGIFATDLNILTEPQSNQETIFGLNKNGQVISIAYDENTKSYQEKIMTEGTCIGNLSVVTLVPGAKSITFYGLLKENRIGIVQVDLNSSKPAKWQIYPHLDWQVKKFYSPPFIQPVGSIDLIAISLKSDDMRWYIPAFPGRPPLPAQEGKLPIIYAMDFDVCGSRNFYIAAINPSSGAIWTCYNDGYDGNRAPVWKPWISFFPDDIKFVSAKIRKTRKKLEIFGLSTSCKLYRVTANPNNLEDKVSITNFDGTYNRFELIADKDGNTMVFALDTKKKMVQWWQEGTSQDWNSATVRVQQPNQLQETRTYTTEIIVRDHNGLPVPRSKVEVRSSDIIPVLINGHNFILDKNYPVASNTNSAGKLTVIMETSSLDVPSLSIQTEFTQGNDYVSIEPNADVKEQLRVVSGSDLMNAKIRDGSPLLSGKHHNIETANSIAQATVACMASIKSASYEGQGIHRSRRIHYGVQYVRDGEDYDPQKLDQSVLEANDWSIDFSSGQPVFTELTHDEAASLINDYKEKYQGIDGFFGFDISWEDLFENIKSGFAAVVEVIVSKAKATVKLLIEGTEYIFNAVLEFVNQAFDVIESIFHKVEVLFEDLFEWLGHLFDWEDILRTHDALKYAGNQMMDFGEKAFLKTKDIIDKDFTQLKGSMKEVMDKMIDRIGDDNLLSIVNKRPKFTNEFDIHSVQCNILVSGFMNNYNAAESRFGFDDLDTTLPESFQRIMDDLKDFANRVESNKAFDEAIEYFNNISKNPSEVLTLATRGLLKIVEGIVLVAIDGVELLIDIVFDAVVALMDVFKQFINAYLYIPLISELYDRLTGNSLTIIDLIMLLLAVPVTVLYRVFKGAAPFPDSTSVDTFKAGFTAEKLLIAYGLESGNKTLVSIGDDREEIAFVLGLCWMVCSVVYGEINAILDLIPIEDVGGSSDPDGTTRAASAAGEIDSIPRPPQKNSEDIILVAQTFYVLGSGLMWGLSCSAIDDPDPGNFGFQDAKSRMNMYWMMGGLMMFIDIVFLAITRRLARYSSLGVIASTALGVFHIYALVAIYIADLIGGRVFDDWAYIKNLLLDIPIAYEVLRLTSIVEASYGISLIVLAALDNVCTEGACAIRLYEIIR